MTTSTEGHLSPRAQERPSVDVYQDLDALPPDVQALFTSAEQTSPEVSLDWYRNLVNTVFRDDNGIRVYTLRKAGMALAALPVRLVREHASTRAESLTNYYSAFFKPAIHLDASAEDLAVALKQILSDGRSIGSFRLSPMDPEAPEFAKLLQAFRLAGLPAFRFFCFGNWYLKVDQDWVTYLKSRSGTLRNTIKRLGKRLANDGGTLELVTGGDRLPAAIDAYQSVYAASWKGTEPYPEFVPGLAQWTAARGWLRLGVVRLNDKPIAAQLWMVANGRAEIYKVAYHQDYQAYAPGTLLTAMLMEHALDTDKVNEVDYLIGDDAYKKTWMGDRRERWGIVAYNPRSFAGLAGLLREVLGRIYRKFKPVADPVAPATK